MKPSFAVFIKREFAGGLSAAIITLPMSIAYGVTAFEALGPAFRPQAAIIGLNAAIFAGFFAALLGGTPTQISGPKAPLTLIMTTVVFGLASDPFFLSGAVGSEWTIVGLASICVFIGGTTQLLCGVLGLGNIIKYVPHPVIAGFMNGIAALLILKQLPPFLGLAKGTDITQVLMHLEPSNGYSALIGIISLIAIFLSKRYLKKIPSFLTGLITGSAVFILLSIWLITPRQLATIGHFQAILPTPMAFLGLRNMHFDSLSTAWVSRIVIYGMVLGVIGSMESLMSSVAIDNLQCSRHDSKQELIGQGIGNIIASFFGALFSAGSIPRSMANYKAGGRHKISGSLCSVLILFMALTMAPLIEKIPLPVFAAIIIAVGINLFDRSSFRLIRALRPPIRMQKDVYISLIVNLSVALITVSVNLITAVMIGMAISTAYFIFKIGASVIRREYSGDRISSNKVRDNKQIRYLNQCRRKIRVFELQGPIFFGSADRLAKIIESKSAEATYCILDMKHVNEIDSTGADILVRVHQMLRKQNQWLLISHIGKKQPLWNSLEVYGVTHEISRNQFFNDTDEALEWVENQLLADVCPADACAQHELNTLDIMSGFSYEELEHFRAQLDLVTFCKGDLLIREGDSDRDFYMLTRGSVSIKMRLPHGNRTKRLFTVGAGAVFGEMALLEGLPRSAQVRAEEDAEAYRLPLSNLEKLFDERPLIAAKLMKNVALVLSHRLRRRSDELRMLMDD